MRVRYCVEAVNRTLRAIMKSPNVRFGGKCTLFSGDFRQILPAAPRGSRGVIVFMTPKSSPLFSHPNLLKLAENIRLKLVEEEASAEEHVLKYYEYLLKVVVGRTCENQESQIKLCFTVKIVPAPNNLVGSIFPTWRRTMWTLTSLLDEPFFVPKTTELLP